MTSLAEQATAILAAADPATKAALARDTAAAWRSGAITVVGAARGPLTGTRGVRGREA